MTYYFTTMNTHRPAAVLTNTPNVYSSTDENSPQQIHFLLQFE